LDKLLAREELIDQFDSQRTGQLTESVFSVSNAYRIHSSKRSS